MDWRPATTSLRFSLLPREAAGRWEAVALVLVPGLAFAHGDLPSAAPATLGWNWDPAVLLPLLLGACLYLRGVTRLWQRAGRGRGVTAAQAAAYAAGIGALVAALLSPLDSLAGVLFSWHMVQHLILILVAAPLLVLGAPEVAFLWALPASARRGFGRFERGMGAVLSGAAGEAGPLLVLLLATGVLWIWHLPTLYELALANEAVHWAEHAGFLLSALLFWATLLRLRSGDRVRNGMRILHLFALAMQGSLLGALLTFASRPLYPSHASGALRAGLDPLADQQLAGLIMWVPPAVLYIGVAAYLFFGWMTSGSERRQHRHCLPPETGAWKKEDGNP